MKRFVEHTDLMMLVRDIQVNNTSGHPGVVWHRRDKVWLARIKFQGRTLHLGSFANKDDAIWARKAAEAKYFNKIIDAYKDEIEMQLEANRRERNGKSMDK